jgi:hypothetical protein
MTVATPVRSCGPVWLRDAPLMLSYVIFPLSNQAAVALGTPLYRNWIDVAWVALLMAVLALRPLGHAARPGAMSRYVLVGVCMVATAVATAGIASGQAPLVTAAMELKPLFYALIAVVVLGRVSAPDPEAFCRYGVVLAVLLVVEALGRSAAGATVERPLGSGEVNYDAALLCISLVFAFADRRLARRYGWVIWAGILASFSRTSLLAGCLVLLLSSVVALRLRLLMGGLAVIAALASFAIRELEVGSVESLDRYWMWVTGLEYLASNPWVTALTAVPGGVIDADVPVFIAELWTDQQENLDLDGVYPFHFHAMWLRLAIAWGWLPATLAAIVFIRHYVTDPRRPPEGRPFFIVCAVLGLTMGLIYLGNVAIVVLLAGAQVLALRRCRLRRSRLATGTPSHAPKTAPLRSSGTALAIATDL